MSTVTIRVNREKCNGCGKAQEPRCVRICPGDLFYRDGENKAALYDPAACWDCAACLKECPREALEMYLPPQIGGRGSFLTAATVPRGTLWTLTGPEGKQKRYLVQSQKLSEREEKK